LVSTPQLTEDRFRPSCWLDGSIFSLLITVIKDIMTDKNRRVVKAELVPVEESWTMEVVAVRDVPAVLSGGRRKAAARVVEFFTANIRNANTRRAYGRAVSRFSAWCMEQGYTLGELSPVSASAYVEELTESFSAPTVKQHLAALRMLCDFLVTGGCLPFNPFASVRGPKHSTKRGKTPVLYEEEARTLLNSIDTSHVVGLRDRAILAVMIYSFARVSAVVNMKVKSYQVNGQRSTIALQEKGGKWTRVPCSHKLAAALDAYLEEAGIAENRRTPLFRSTTGCSRTLTKRGMARQDVLAMVKRRCREAGLSEDVSNHSFRATGITAYLGNGSDLETAAAIAGHASTRTTQLYNRNSERISQAEPERIRI